MLEATIKRENTYPANETCYVVFTERNGYKNVYGNFVFRCREDAEQAVKEANDSGYYDNAWFLRMWFK